MSAAVIAAFVIVPMLDDLLGSNSGRSGPAPVASTAEPRFESGKSIPLSYREECNGCGAVFVVDALELEASGSFRVHITVRNTGELGDLSYVAGVAYALDPSQAERFSAAVEIGPPALRTIGFVAGVTPHWFPMSRVPAEEPLPAVLKSGNHWTGWLRFAARPPGAPGTSGPAQGLPRETVGLVIVLVAAQDGRHPGWISSQPGLPYISIPR